MDTRIHRIETRDTAARDAIFDALDGFNDEASGLPQPAGWLGLLLREPGTERVTGGLWAVSYYEWMFVELLFIPPALRGQGMGRQLIAEAENVARQRNCRGMWLDTFSFQAPRFYEKLGFQLFGRIEDYPPGSSRSFYAKRFDAGAAPAAARPNQSPQA